MLPQQITTRQSVLSVTSLVAAALCLALVPWLPARNALAGISGLIAGISELVWYQNRMAVGFLKAGLLTFLIGVPLAPEVVDHRTWYALQPLFTYAAAQTGVVLAYFCFRWVRTQMRSKGA
jgi:hypothetical protein